MWSRLKTTATYRTGESLISRADVEVQSSAIPVILWDLQKAVLRNTGKTLEFETDLVQREGSVFWLAHICWGQSAWVSTLLTNMAVLRSDPSRHSGSRPFDWPYKVWESFDATLKLARLGSGKGTSRLSRGCAWSSERTGCRPQTLIPRVSWKTRLLPGYREYYPKCDNFRVNV